MKWSVLDYRVPNAIVAAVNYIVVPWVEKAVMFNEYESSRAPRSLVNDIELGDLVGNNHGTPYLDTLSRNDLDQLGNKNWASIRGHFSAQRLKLLGLW